MTSTLKILLDICLLRGQPQDLPASKSLVLITALVSVISTYALDPMHEEMLKGLVFAASQTVLLGAVVWVALMVRGYTARWMQTVAPLYAAGSLVDAIKWLVLASGFDPGAQSQQPWLSGFVLAISLWFIAIMANVLRHALAVSVAVAVLVSLSCVLAAGIGMILLFPEVLPTVTPAP
jgi:hypothetical protein